MGMKRSWSASDLGDSHIPKRFQRGMDDGTSSAVVPEGTSSAVVPERVIDKGVDREEPGVTSADHEESIHVFLLSDVGSDGLVPYTKAIGIDVLSRLYSLNSVLVYSPLCWLDELPHKVAQDPLFIGFQVANYAKIIGSGVSAFLFNNVHTQGWNGGDGGERQWRRGDFGDGGYDEKEVIVVMIGNGDEEGGAVLSGRGKGF
ncbi:hypothetical protein LguiB_017854 [Lonicera macranthoides]